MPYFSLNIYATSTIWAGPVSMDCLDSDEIESMRVNFAEHHQPA
jgi:hypothetical protein